MKFPRTSLNSNKFRYITFAIYSIFLLLLPEQLHANSSVITAFANQNSSFFHLLHPNKSEFELGFLYQPKKKEKNGPGEFDLYDYHFNVDLIAPQSYDSYVNFGFNYRYKSYDLKPVVSLTEESSIAVHRIPFTLGYGAFLTEDLLLHAQGTAGVYSDLDQFPRTEDFQLHGKAFSAYRINPFVQIVAGLLYSNDFDEDLVPLLGLRLQSGGGKLHLSITAPIEANISYFITPHTSLYLNGSIVGDEYRITAGPVDTELDLRHQDRRLGLGLTHWFNDRFNFSAEIGTDLNSEFEFDTMGAGQFNGGTDNAFYGTLRLGLAL